VLTVLDGLGQQSHVHLCACLSSNVAVSATPVHAACALLFVLQEMSVQEDWEEAAERARALLASLRSIAAADAAASDTAEQQDAEGEDVQGAEVEMQDA
jgi:hypothetical protein